MRLQSLINRRASLSPSGFTLVELMIVVALIALLAAFSTPSIAKTIERNNAKKAARDVGNAFNLARNQAMSRGEVVLIKIDKATTTKRGEIRLYRTANRALSCTTAEFPWGTGGDSTGDDGDDAADAADGDDAAGGTGGFGGSGDGYWGMDEEAATAAAAAAPDPKEPFFTLSFDTLPANMAIRGMAPEAGTKADPICIAANGRVMKRTGETLDGSVCPFRIFIGKDGAGTFAELAACEATLNDTQRQAKRDERDVARFHVVELPYNGSVRIIQ